MSGEELLGVDGCTPFSVDADHFGARTTGNVAEAAAEHAVHSNDDRVTRADKVHDARFHAGRSGARHRERWSAFDV